MSGFGLPELIGVLVVLLVIFVPLVLWIWSLVDIIRYEFPDNLKVIWLLVVFFIGPIGSIVYFIVGRKQRLIGGAVTGQAGSPFCSTCGRRLDGAVICPNCNTPQKASSQGSKGAVIAVVVVICVFAFVFIIGILAAIAIPQFVSYRTKAFDMAAKQELKGAKGAVENYYSTNNVYPASLDQAGYATTTPQVAVTLERLEDGNYMLMSYHEGGRKVYVTSSGSTDILSKTKEAPDSDYAPETEQRQ